MSNEQWGTEERSVVEIAASKRQQQWVSDRSVWMTEKFTFTGV
jgi:hypothetical protein